MLSISSADSFLRIVVLPALSSPSTSTRASSSERLSLRSIVPSDAPAWKASGYGVMRAAVEGTLSMAAAIERVIIETRQYAKRQRTWFRHQLPESAVTRVNPLDQNAVAQAHWWWKNLGSTSAAAGRTA